MTGDGFTSDHSYTDNKKSQIMITDLISLQGFTGEENVLCSQ